MKLLISTFFTLLLVGFAVSSYGQIIETINYSDGSVYVGEFKDDQLNGQGTFTSADGSVYVGEFKDDQLNGQGTYTSADGGVYVGEYKDNERNGQGAYTSASGNVYVGEYKDGQINGRGTLTSADGDVYVGEFKDDQFSGQGTFTFADGDVDVGEFEDNRSKTPSDRKSFFGSVLSGLGTAAKVVFTVAEAVNRQEARNQEYMNEQRGKTGNQGYQGGLPTYLEYKDDGLCYYDDGTVIKIGVGLCPLVR